jgi:hypothetical protein
MQNNNFSGMPVNSSAGYKVAGVQLNSTPVFIDSRNNDINMEENITAVGALSTTVAVSHLNFAAGGAVTLAAPTKPCFLKIIKVDQHTSNYTLALTNIVDGTASTTATFTSTSGRLVLLSDSVTSGKWIVIHQSPSGLTLS